LEEAVGDTLYLVAANLMGLAGLASALAKMLQEPDPFRLHKDRLLAISNERWFCVTQLSVAVLLVLPLPMIIQAGAAVAVAIVVVGSEIRHLRHPEEESEGFGSMSPSSQVLYFSIGAAVVAAATYVVVAAVPAPGRIAISWPISGATIVIVSAIALRLRFDQSRGQGYAHKIGETVSISGLPDDLMIGWDARGTVTARDLAAAGRSSLIVGIEPHSQQCRDVHALLAKHAELLSRELTLVVIAPNDSTYEAAPRAAVRRLVDAGSHLSRFLGIHARPYAMLVSDNLSLLAPPSQTSHKVQRLITLLVTTIQNAPTTILTMRQNDQWRD
jgi:hypothetical protein